MCWNLLHLCRNIQQLTGILKYGMKLIPFLGTTSLEKGSEKLQWQEAVAGDRKK